MKLRLILCDQLNPNHSWFSNQDNNIRYLMMEIKPKPGHVKQHKQKLLARFASMQIFANELKKEGHNIRYIHLNDPDNEHNIGWNILNIIEQNRITAFEYQEPDNYDTDVELQHFCEGLDIPTTMVSSEHFLTERSELAKFFAGKKQPRIDNYYKHLRKKHQVLMYENGEPYGGKWIYLKENIEALPRKISSPAPLMFHHDLTSVEETLDASGIECIGKAGAGDFNWPLTRSEALEQLDYFIDKLLPEYGKYQNSMSVQSHTLYHSRLSFALNQKMLNPGEIVEKACNVYKYNQKNISLPQIEAFIRNLIGFREYMRGIYWQNMPGYRHKNHFFAERRLPDFFRDGNTDMNCLKQVITQSLDKGWIHHNQRLAIAGNFLLLSGVHPDEADIWFSSMFVDAREWIQLPNTRGLSQFADAGITVTKPYAFSANFISKVSDYCKFCSYNKSKKLSKDACPLNALYWHFYHRNRKRLSWIRRTRKIYETWDNMETKTQQAYLNKADGFLKTLDK
ncbi:MAG: cryptochrome/photolyase family protein [Bacteroidales bacterium]